ncbi:hypothetical protein ABID70_000944 [Clavibacter michiganensis]|uniref:hypothetical protein n=1 Tax=Clavibacter michiganensis TaxID=28447 RepID=UPI001AE7BD7B|nr:hypothetical protein [Clavibacter michiganensis]MBP2458385.1 hypothetical protein [Clavibacter michiganensis]MDQ0410956.1 hypothetical protein [Clavibacter michiganensis]
MSTFVLLFSGGSAPASEEGRQASAAAWREWFDRVGDALVDPGSPFGAVARYGAETAPSGITGYSIVTSDDADAIALLLDGHPHLAAGGTIEAHETVPA